MSTTPQGSLRQRNVPGSSKKKNGSPAGTDSEVDSLDKLVRKQIASPAASELDYKIAFVVITVLAFISRFWGISHPNEVVFDEVHFGKVRRHRL